jgi:hypothetical protein
LVYFGGPVSSKYSRWVKKGNRLSEVEALCREVGNCPCGSEPMNGLPLFVHASGSHTVVETHCDCWKSMLQDWGWREMTIGEHDRYIYAHATH